MRDSIPDELKRRLIIKVSKTKTANLVNEALSQAALQPQYGEPWIIFDRDQVKNFDDIIQDAETAGINVGWSNPCIEIWFNMTVTNKIKKLEALGLIELKTVQGNNKIYKHSIAERAFNLTRGNF